MDKYSKFYDHLQDAANEFRKIGPGKTIRVVSHLDADGISSCSILIRALTRQNMQFVVSIVQNIDENLAKALKAESHEHVAFTDLGSGQFSILKEYLQGKKVFIFDHHELDSEQEAEGFVHVNPHIFGIDGSKEIAGAGVTYLFAKSLDSRNTEMAHIAIIGAIGDVQENSGFGRLNNEILADAVAAGKIKVVPGLKIFGTQTKPLYKLLAHSSQYRISQITGSESRAIQFLLQTGINPKEGEKWRKLGDLTEDEMKSLVTGILLRRLNEKEPEAIIGPTYILCEESRQSLLRDAKEFSTLLNACGRMDKASLGIGVCLNDKKQKAKAIEHMATYRKEIVKAMNWFEESYNANKIIRGKNYVIINAEDKILHTMIGTLASIISKSNLIENDMFIMSLARMGDGNTKVSLRASSSNNPDLKELISKMAEAVKGTSGGHMGAAGAIIRSEVEQEFIETAKNTFESMNTNLLIDPER
ncbi:DHH family phosphoesterase [Candidatus Woesearchaeota archaeon]|nr:DHH family phosphoesterase [Candidatus Woesearchaeota archaeon]